MDTSKLRLSDNIEDRRMFNPLGSTPGQKSYANMRKGERMEDDGTITAIRRRRIEPISHEMTERKPRPTTDFTERADD